MSRPPHIAFSDLNRSLTRALGLTAQIGAHPGLDDAARQAAADQLAAEMRAAILAYADLARDPFAMAHAQGELTRIYGGR